MLTDNLSPAEYADHCFSAAEDYIESVRSGSVTVGKAERLAVERFLRHYDRDDIWIDIPAVDRVFRFFSALKHSKGKWRGTQFVLADWQCFCTLCIFGLKRVDSVLRLVRLVYIQVARKNGKSTWLAGIALYLLAYDGENGAEVFSAATKKDQAKIVWEEARRMVLQSAVLRTLIKPSKTAITVESEFSSFLPLGKDADTLDGLNPSATVIDELHAHKTAEVWNVLDTGSGAREQPLLFAITTAGSNTESICYEQRDYGLKLLEEVIEDDEYFIFICEPDSEDDWTDETLYRKGNPSLGVTVRLEELITRRTRAQNSPRLQNDFRRKRLDQWTEQDERWIDVAAWSACRQDLPDLSRKRAFAGLDLSSKVDLTAFVLAIPLGRGTEPFAVVPFFWLPESRIEEYSRDHRVPYPVWRDQGYLRVTPGNVVDYEWIERDIVELLHLYDIQEIGFDPWNSSALVHALNGQLGVRMIEMRQGYATLSAPSKEFERCVLAKTVRHAGHPVMDWNISNVSVRTDPAGNIKPDKSISRLKIDGVVAAVMALGRLLGASEDNDETISIVRVA